MADVGCSESVRKWPGMALADLCDTEGFDKDGEENQPSCMVFNCLMGCTKEKRFPKRGR